VGVLARLNQHLARGGFELLASHAPGAALSFAQMAADVGGLSCAFNSTVYEDTLASVPDIVAWGQQHIDIVHVLVFITFRAALTGAAFDYYVGGQRVVATNSRTPPRRNHG
jgi:hypothetical protein